MKGKFFNFIQPFLSYIDNGKLFRKPFSWLYILLALCSLIVIPFVAIRTAIQLWNFEFSFGVLIALIFALAAAWVGFQIWWNRSKTVLNSSAEGSEFPAIPVISHFIQTAGEFMGSFTAIFGFGITLGDSHIQSIGISFGYWGLIINPIAGFLIVVVFRLVAELIRVMAAIANNTKK